MPALDGLRALAVMAVIVYHADAAWLPGGYLGVEVFFAISGYLITALLITEFDRTDRIDFVDFWKRRAKRLLPALGVLLIGVALLAMFTARDALGSLWGQSVAASTYVMNWSLIATEQSYFESFGRPPLLQHLWSLAIEEQFYLLMPALFLAGRRLLGRRITLGVVLAGIVASVTLMWTGFDPTVDPSRLYYGTDTRAAGILVGVAMAMVWRPWVAGGPLTERLRASAWPDIAGVAGLLVIGHQLWTLGAYDARLYRGGFLLIAVATVAVVAAVANPGSLVAVPLSAKPLRWIGQRSYGLYLWHWPVFMVLRPGVDTIVSEPWLTVLRLSATVALAELSFTFIERPVREGRFGQQVVALFRSAPETPVLRRGVAIVAISGISLFAVGNVQLARQSPAAAAPIELATTDGTTPSYIPKGVRGEVMVAEHVDGPPTPLSTDEPVDEPPADPDTLPAYDFGRVFVVGDSVMVGAAEQVETLDGVVMDARIGRQWHELLEMPEVDPGPDDAVVIHLGNNGAVTTDTLDAVLERFSDAGRVVLVTVRVPRPWESQVNRALSGATGRYPNTVLADWQGASDGTPNWFGGDGVHLTQSGAKALRDTIAYALRVD
ncbi:acyltransferase family protein [Euzebya rosea]|uniref:acyltransferase family protein n=1 Tax=Euzebya rosea TaxID=2052804 RepID=UPI001300B46F|nr:acyltransferase family protein [Euzebya rosea]